VSCEVRSIFQVSKGSGFYPCPVADAAGVQVVSQAGGGLLLCETVRVVGLDQELAAALAPWRRRLARPGQDRV
jgi:hypothetical protein